MADVILWNTSFDEGQSAIFVSFSCGVGGVDKGGEGTAKVVCYSTHSDIKL
jgi:hypothetical protein